MCYTVLSAIAAVRPPGRFAGRLVLDRRRQRGRVMLLLLLLWLWLFLFELLLLLLLVLFEFLRRWWAA